MKSWLSSYGRVKAITILLALCSFAGSSQTRRTKLSINQNWFFSKAQVDPLNPAAPPTGHRVDLPHTWNDKDVTDDSLSYHRAACWYVKKLEVDKSWIGKSISIYFEGANQETEVYVNGKPVGKHIGGYTRFNFAIEKYLNFEEGSTNTLAVKVDNSHNDNVPPLSADFTFFGGIYRDVYLLITEPVHFSHKYAASGIYITTPTVSSKAATVKVKSVMENKSGIIRKIRLETTVRSSDGKVVARNSNSISLKPNVTHEFSQNIQNILNPELWSPERPYLYRVSTKIFDARTGQVLDDVTNPLGFRWFRFDGNTGFYLNDKPYKLVGASRHQDFKGKGNALSDVYHINDLKHLKEMGGNFLRVAHYPQDPAVLEACDRLGILASVEIPIVNAITESEEFYQNAMNMQVEMIRQNFNHPSIILWAYMNEVMLRPKFVGQKERQEVYFNNITKLAEQLEVLTRKEDPSRYTMISHHGDYNRYKQYRLIDIPMVVGWNLYQGWYSGSLQGFADFLDRHHRDFPDKPLMVTEYGADADPRIRSLNPERFDKSIDYALNFHEFYFKAMKNRPFVAAAMIWNLADFNSETREETMPHINNKGILTLDRKPKDLYRYYQSQLLQRPYIEISDWLARSGVPDSLTDASTQPLDVFSNAAAVELVVNGKSIGKLEAQGKRFTWQVPFLDGINTVEAIGTFASGERRHQQQIEFSILSARRDNRFNNMNILLGAQRQFTDEFTGEMWIPDQAYKPGSWGHIGGESFKLSGNNRQGYGTDRNIRGTDSDPIYQTQQVGIKKYKLDVADGEYDLILHFAELLSGEVKEALVYNLDNSARKDQAEDRSFDITVNNQIIFNDFNIKKRYGALVAGSEKIKVTVENGQGIEIGFSPQVGQPVLNALQLIKRY